MSHYVVMDIGCLECGESTELVGVYATTEEAHRARVERAGGEDGWYMSGGQHMVDVFEIKAAS